MDEIDEFTGAIVLCPVCCTSQDADGWGHQAFECMVCETEFTVELVAEKVAVHAMYG
jgi:uncharacterized protein (DUF2225 family)